MRIISIFSIVFSALFITGSIGLTRQNDEHQGEIYLPGLVPYRVIGEVPERIKDVFGVQLEYQRGKTKLIPDLNGNAPIEGYLMLVDHTGYVFKVAELIREKKGYTKLVFETDDVRGEHFEFRGEFFDPPRFSDGRFTSLEGILRRYRGTIEVANSRIGFSVFTIE